MLRSVVSRVRVCAPSSLSPRAAALSSSSSCASASPAAAAPPKTVKVTVDGREVDVDAGYTVLQACAAAGVQIPRFCFHERLSIAGNCRMCLVEVEKSPKPVASCAMPVMNGMKVFTASEKTMKAREGVMEFLLANHPLDCPICDQGGECDLQDQSMSFGSDRSRFSESKRAVEDKDLGPLVKTVMTRCIHCTRCVRFATEVAGVEDLGMTGRGNDSQIGTYVSKCFGSELSGNVVDLCPVGALTSRPYAFIARSWELHRTPSIDALDAIGSNIEVDVRNGEVMRVLPRNNDDVNEEWLGDKSRYAVDGLKRQRLHNPMAKDANGVLRTVSWREAFERIRKELATVPAQNIVGVAGALACAESMVALRDLVHRLGSENVDVCEDGMRVSADFRTNYLTSSTIAGAESADLVLLVGVNPRVEATLFNTRLRKAVLFNDAAVVTIGPEMNLTYRTHSLGSNMRVLGDIAEGKHALLQLLRDARRPMVVVGTAALQRPDADNVLATVHALAAQVPNLVTPEWNGINVLHRAASRVGGLDLGLVPGIDAGKFAPGRRAYYLLNADDMMTSVPSDAFVIYQGHHGDAGAHRADVILAGSAYTEKDATYVNTEGRVQRTRRALFPPGDAREDWQIVRALSEALGAALPYDTLPAVRQRMADIAPHFGAVDDVFQTSTFVPFALRGANAAKPWAGLDTVSPVDAGYTNYYMTDPVSRASVTMAKCTAVAPSYLVRANAPSASAKPESARV